MAPIPSCLVFLPRNSIGVRLRRALEAGGYGEQLRFARDLETLAHLLSHPDHGFRLAVLVADQSSRLKEFVGLADQLADLGVLLVVPDTSDETTALAHALGPRYITRIDDDFSEFPEILGRLLRRWTSEAVDEPKSQEEKP